MTEKLHIRILWKNRWRAAKSFLAHYLGGLYHRTDEHHIFLMASGLAFSLIVCVIPLVLIVFSVLGMILSEPTIHERIELFINTAIPYSDYAEVIKQVVFARVEEFVGHKRLAGVIGALGLLLAATSLFSSMRTTLNKVFNVASTGSILIGKLRDLGLILLVLICFLLSIAVLPALKFLADFTYENETMSGVVGALPEGMLLHLITFTLVFISFVIVYAAVPHQHPQFRMILVSAFWAAVLWQMAQQLFDYYVSNFVTLTRIYGAYALFLAVGFWIYYSSIVFIVGAEIGQLYKERHADLD